MTTKQALFVQEYRKDFNATQAAIRAGYSPNGAGVTGVRMLKDPKIAQMLAQDTKIAVEDGKLDAERAIREAAALAFSDVAAFYDDNGNIKPMKEWTPAMRAAVQSLETLERDVTPGERGPAAKVHRLKLWDKPKNLDLLFKHLGLLIEKVQHSGDVTFKWQT